MRLVARCTFSIALISYKKYGDLRKTVYTNKWQCTNCASIAENQYKIIFHFFVFQDASNYCYAELALRPSTTFYKKSSCS